MAKFFGKIAYGVSEESSPGVWTVKIVERDYYGEVNRRTRRWVGTDNLNDNLDVSNELSIVADPYALEHFHNIRYVVWANAAWKVSSVEVDYPRLNLLIGGLYNGERAQT